jgi:hypothetical protein
MANGMDLKERSPGRDIPDNDPLMELSRIMGFDPSGPVADPIDPQIAAEDSFSMDLERELAIEEVPSESGAFDADFAAEFEDSLTDVLRIEADAPPVVPTLEDELSALLDDANPRGVSDSVNERAFSGPTTDSLHLEDDIQVGDYLTDDGDLEAENTVFLEPATSEVQLEPTFPWPEVAKDDALEAELENDLISGYHPATQVVHSFDANELDVNDQLDPEAEISDFEFEAGEVKLEDRLADGAPEPDPLAFSAYQDLELAEPPLEIQVEPAVADSQYDPEDGFDAYRELADLEVPPAPEFGEWPAKAASVPVEAELADVDDELELHAVEEQAPLVEASEPKQDEVLHTDDFDIPDFEFQSLTDAPQPFDSDDEFADDIALAAPVQPARPEVGKSAFDDSDFDFDSLIGEELAAGAGAAALSVRGNPAMHVDADLDADPFRRTPIADDVFAPVAVEPAGRKPWLVPVALAGVLALFGGGLYYAFSGDGASVNAEGPALVTADPEPVKIAPENPGGATVANQDKAVYDKVEGEQAALPAQGALVSDSEEPVDIAAVTPPSEPEAPMEASAPDEAAAPAESTAKAEDRVETPVAEEAQAPAAETAAVTPKKVRTVIVKPDGTLVERPVEAAAASAEIQATESNPVASIAPAEAPAAEVVVAAPVPAAKPEAAAAAPAEPAPAAEDPIAQIAAVEPEPATVAEPAPAEPVAVEAQPEPVAAEPVIKVVKAKKIKPPVAEKAAASAEAVPVPGEAGPIGERPADQPVNIVGQTGGQQPAAETQVAAADPAPASGAYSIQIASTPSPEAAKSTYAALSRKFGGVIGGKGVNIQKANVEGKGTVYRVRIPAGSKQNAAALCSEYKSAGGSCFVTK